MIRTMLTPKADFANRIKFTNNLKIITNRFNLICYKTIMFVKNGTENIFWGLGNFFMGVSPISPADLLK